MGVIEEPGGPSGVDEQSRGGHTSAVDDETDEIRLGELDTDVRRVRW